MTEKIPMRLAQLLLMLAAAGAAVAEAAEWQAVAARGAERVEIDASRIMRSAKGVAVAWSRLTLGRELADEGGGSYTAIQAMNRYDCASGRFATLERVYFHGDKAVREENVKNPREVKVPAGGVEARLLAEVCKPQEPSEAKSTVKPASRTEPAAPSSSAQAGRPGVMYADVRTGEEAAKVKTVPVADGARPEPAAEPERPKTAADTRIEVRPPSERPRFIGLPPKLERPPADAPQAPTSAAETKTAPKPAAKAPPEAATAISPASRHERERMMATSGPRRTSPVKAAPAVEAPAPVVQHRDIPWAYEGEGAPAQWAKLRPEHGLCATGRRQSPIDIREGIKVDLEQIRFDYKASRFRIVDTGHTIEVEVGEGSTMNVMGRNHELLRFHFHRPSEERINGKGFDMVIHLEHRDDEGRLATVAVLLEKGAENPLIQTLWNHMPLEVNQEVLPEVAIDLNRLLPQDRAYYTYMGSMTTPPCTEDMLWIVFKQPMPVSEEQVRIFARLYRNNARPVQPSNARLVKESR